MDESLCVGGGQTGCDLHSDSQNLDKGQRPIVIESAPQRRLTHVRHDKIGEPINIRHAVDFHHAVMNYRDLLRADGHAASEFARLIAMFKRCDAKLWRDPRSAPYGT